MTPFQRVALAIMGAVSLATAVTIGLADDVAKAPKASQPTSTYCATLFRTMPPGECPEP